MTVGPAIVRVVNLALVFCNLGTIWAYENDIFRSWRLVGVESFHTMQSVHWRKLPYWIFAPVSFSLIGGILLIWYHPSKSPFWAFSGALVCQLLTLVLTALLWGRLQAKLANGPLGPQSPCLGLALRTHWVGTLLYLAF